MTPTGSVASTTFPSPLPSHVDVTVIGGGILGLGVAREILGRRPGLRVAVLEREREVATHQTGRNSGVLHAGLYYQPGSLKARYCREGKGDARGLRGRAGHPVRALRQTRRRPRRSRRSRPSSRLYERGQANGVPGLEIVGPERIAEIEPHVRAVRGLWSPSTGIIDYRDVSRAFADDIAATGGSIHTSTEVTGISGRRRESRRHDHGW